MDIHGESNENVYAYNLQWEEVYIDDVEVKGRGGYYCLGCKREMQAIISTTGKVRNYFRHDSKATKKEGKCTYRDETYRHKIAKEILGRIKKVKVPSIYKFPPNGVEGSPVLIEKSKFISAHSVRNELSFYEDENCKVIWGGHGLADEKYLLIRPDVTFFDKDSNPILFIEIEVTHKITDEKINKIKRLGVDTIKIKIPRDSPQSIEKAFSSTSYTKWIYSNVESNTEYIQIPESFNKGIPSIDEIPEEFYHESFKCRRSQIRSLIQRIGICLESEQYRSSVEGFESEISRVTKSTEQLERRIEEHRNTSRERYQSKYHKRDIFIKDQAQLFKREEEEFRAYKREQEEKFREYQTELEERYNRKNEDLKERISWIRRHNEIAEPETTRKIEREESNIIAERRNCEKERRNIGEEQDYGKQLETKYRAIQEGIRVEFEEKTRHSIDQVERRSAQGGDEFSIGLSELLKARRIIDDFETNVNDYKRYRTAKKLFDQRVFKKWN